MKPANYGPFYAAGLYPALAEVFRAHGYALAVHGSVASDFDLIAVPWVEDAGEIADIIADVMKAFACSKFALSTDKDGGTRPHGRTAYKIHMSFGPCALDVSFMPKATVKGAT